VMKKLKLSIASRVGLSQSSRPTKSRRGFLATIWGISGCPESTLSSRSASPGWKRRAPFACQFICKGNACTQSPLDSNQSQENPPADGHRPSGLLAVLESFYVTDINRVLSLVSDNR
jgi:hypothetical protein